MKDHVFELERKTIMKKKVGNTLKAVFSGLNLTIFFSYFFI